MNANSNSNVLDELLEKIEIIKNKSFTEEELMLQEEIVKSREDYEKVLQKYEKYYEFEELLNELAWDTPGKRFVCRGYCAICGKDVVMYYKAVQREKARREERRSELRENFYCPLCNATARWRYVISKVRRAYNKGMKIYMYEYNSPAYLAAASFVSENDLIGSEYFGSEYKSGEYINGVLHEDAANLSFADNSLDIVLSLDVFEHIYFYKKALEEIFRVLKPNGKLLLTIPMDPENETTKDRAKIENGETIFLDSPIYHGGANHTDFGVLVYTDFGWDIIPIIESIGFSEVNLTTYYSVNESYFGRVNYCFEITK